MCYDKSMLITINIDKSCPEETGLFTVHEVTPVFNTIISELQNMSFKLIASKDGRKYQIDLHKIKTIYASNKKVYIFLENKQEFLVNQSLSSLEEYLSKKFLRISNSEIINSSKVSSFEFTFGGKIKIYFNDESYTYSSRSYLLKIKEKFGI